MASELTDDIPEDTQNDLGLMWPFVVEIIHNVDGGESKTIQDLYFEVEQRSDERIVQLSRRLNWHEEALEAAGKEVDDDTNRVRFLEAVQSGDKYDQLRDSLIIDDTKTRAQCIAQFTRLENYLRTQRTPARGAMATMRSTIDIQSSQIDKQGKQIAELACRGTSAAKESTAAWTNDSRGRGQARRRALRERVVPKSDQSFH